MKKIAIILTAFLVGSCNQAKKQKQTSEPDVSENAYTVYFRPDEKIQMGKIYTDTLVYSGVEDTEYCSFIILRTGDNEFSFINSYTGEGNKLPQLKFDDWVEVQWKMDGIRCERQDVQMQAVSIKKIEPQFQLKIKHYYTDDGGSYGRFFNDGNCVVYDNYLSEEQNVAYKEYPTYLFNGIGQKKWLLFDDWGYICRGWEIINHYRVFSRLQITNFEPETAKILSDIQNIKETRLIFIVPKDGYEEWIWYQDDRKQEYAAKDIQSVDAQKRYLSFTLYDGEKIIIDTKKEQNSKFPPSALLYRKGYIPIMISISGESEEGMEEIENYINREFHL